MKKLKFRIWDKSSNTMLSWFGLMQAAWNTKDYSLVYEVFQQHNNNLVIQQYIGIQDINGADIYEGDILSSEDFGMLKIEWRKFYSGYKFGAVRLNGDSFDLYGYIPEDTVIIGNIFEDKELLN